MGTLAKMTRRAFLLGSVAIAGGVAFGYYKYQQPYPNPLGDDTPDTEEDTDNNPVALTPYVLIDAQGITIITPRAEMGQGIHTTLAALVAEELDVAWEDIRTIHGPTSNAYYNSALLSAGVAPSYDQGTLAGLKRGTMGVLGKFLGLQITGGSTSTIDAYEKMREAGAAARLVLIEAASRQWNVAARDLTTADGFVIHPRNDNRLAYSELAQAAATIEIPKDITLKDKSEWRYLGKTMPKKDMVAKCTGTATFGIDVQQPDMVYATVVMNPRQGGGMKSFDDSAAKSMRGVRKIIPLQGGVAVVADNTWRAFKAAEAIKFEWEDAPYPPTTEAMFEQMADAFTTLEPDAVHHDEGDVEAALAESGNIIEAEYRAPFLAHSTMEPMNATALLTDDALHIWTGTQGPTSLRDAAAKAIGLEPEQVQVHVELLGGGFGRRGEPDFGLQAAQIAKAMQGTPVKLTWTREEDTRHDVYRPGAIGRFRAVMSDSGIPETLQIRVSSPSATRSALGRLGVGGVGPDKMIVEGCSDQPYTIRNHQIIGYAPDIPIPLGFWRSVGASYNGFFHECFLDELAVAAKVDPLQMRLNMTKDFRAAHEVLKAVGELSGWDKPLSKGRARGLAMTLSFGSYTAQVIEVSETKQGISIDKVYCVVDPGIALDPGNIEAQMQSGIIYGLTAAVMGEITFVDGEAQQSNFHDYPALKLAQTPDIEVKILENGQTIQGIGEPGTPPSKPALGNAIFALTGQRLREYPFNKHVKFA